MTGRETILKAASEVGVNRSDAERIASTIDRTGYVCVPRDPTQEMIEAAWASALAENAAGVWSRMVEESEKFTAAETPG